ncbi:hypothetical protein F5Y11DRAFT_337498 [Daldinia sp. FL1419]|nr:hypothetical protein F5Y11DRAFT_337498 [Daldinia sp. FL1419]
MASYNGNNYTIVVDDRRSYRSPSASSYSTTTSRTSLGTSSTSYPSYPTSGSSGEAQVTHGRSSKADNYTVDITSRSSVDVYNHHSTGYEESAPTPDYRHSSAKKERKNGNSHSGSR